MKNKHIFLNILVIATFLLTLIVEGAEFNEKNGSEENIDQIQKETLSQESLALLTLVSNTYERNCLVDIIVKLLFSYSALLLKFSYFFNENVLHEQIKRLRETIFHANLESFFINKYLLIDYQKLERLYNSCFDYLRYNTINQLNTESLNQQYAFIMNIVENHAKIIKPIRESQALLEYLISCDLDLSLKSMVSILINYVSEFISLVEESIKTYKKKKRNFKKFFDSRKDFLSNANIDLVVSNQKLQSMMEMKVNFEKNKELLDEYNKFLENPDPNLTEEKVSQLKQLYNDYYENNECTEEEILEMESLLSISMELLGLISANIFYFNNQELSENIRLVEEVISNINKKVSTRGTENSFDGEYSFRIKKRVMENLNYEKVISLNNLSSKFSNKLPREVIIKNLKGLYLCLLNILKMLKIEFQLNKCGKYIQELMLLVINTYEKIGKECAASLKSNEKNESLTILPLETIRVIRESTISKCKQIITEQVEKKKEKMKEEKEKLEKLEMEKKIQLEQEKLDYKKRLEKLKEKSKSKQKKSYPEVKYEIKKVQECDTIILETQKIIRPTVRNKAERRRKLMEEINRFNEKSIKKELIREAVNIQKLTRKSKKNLSSGERRSKLHSMETNNAQTKDQNTHNIDMGSDSSQNSSNESSGDEETCSSEVKKKKYVKKKDFSECLLPVIKLVEESIYESNKSHQQSKGEGISEESEGACSSHATEKKVSKKRLANEKPSDTPLVKSTVELFGESFVFETRKVGQRGIMEGTSKSSSLRETSNSSSSVSQIESISDKQLFGKQSNSEARKSRSRAKSSKLSVRRALSEPPPRNKPSSNLKTRPKSIPRTRSRSRSRSRSRRRRKSTSRSKLHLKSEIYSDDGTSEMISKLMQLEEKMSYSVDDSSEHKSKFIPMFSKSKVTEEVQSVDIFSFFNIVNLDFLEITEASTIEEIEAAIEFCSEEITRIHTEILPLLTGYDLLQMKDFQKDLISRLIRLLIMFNNKKNE
ncbi:putative Secreted Protein (SKSR family) [Cryptosporidium hominis]|uniref:Secreted Protein (SKSR family) n=1 Tax=Cryptosporidium hominis TaxID=237895 RepID=A0ABX5BIJ6_CRYHO|nr:putative Secreted Protein (SKSR family) [Cryptosporidium hominis]|eukprot:PPS97176.1 putative Secreted Protein (SKSR family) [Cryptosporidium hominis]